MNTADLKLKVCGLKNRDNLSAVAELQPDFIGLIFYPKSPRYAGDLDPETLAKTAPEIERVGVFVNEDNLVIQDLAEKYGLTTVQLHGDESPEACASLRNSGLKVVKAFGLHSDFDFNSMRPYLPVCDLFLLDTKTASYGGSGEKFGWQILEKYPYRKPYLLSGGIGAEDAEKIKALQLPHPPKGIDINSRFEIEPGLKNVEMIRGFINQLNSEK